jgi:hypothetical protein
MGMGGLIHSYHLSQLLSQDRRANKSCQILPHPVIECHLGPIILCKKLFYKRSVKSFCIEYDYLIVLSQDLKSSVNFYFKIFSGYILKFI